ncbi:hypothetical protein [Fusibacter sp. JL216-2]|uniref:hypothetical protein n=1 Tax=Fusibacter sp. JL216-2 TaxID=3071453 RepID=UPI003D357A67
MMEKDDKWYWSLVLLYPIFVIFTIVYMLKVSKLPSDDIAIFGFGVYWIAVSLLSLVSNIFFLRIPGLTAYIYEHNYVQLANFVLLAIGLILTLGSIFIYGIEVVSQFFREFIIL